MDREQTEQEVLQFANVWMAAEVRGDTDFLARTRTDDFVAVGPRGFVLTKGEYVGRHHSGNLTYNALDLDEVTVRVYDTTAILIGRQVQDASYRGNRVEPQLRITAVLIQRAGQWQFASVHMSPVAPPPSVIQQVTEA